RTAAVTGLEFATIRSGVNFTASVTCRLTNSASTPVKRFSISTLRPSIQPKSRMPSRNALMRDFWSGSFSSRPISTLTRGIFFEPCARAADGHEATAPPSTLIKSRRLIVVAPEAQIRNGNNPHRSSEGAVSEPSYVRFGSKADMCSARAHVRFTPNSDRESGHRQTVRSALPPKADMCSATRDVCFGPIADIATVANHCDRGTYDRLGALLTVSERAICPVAKGAVEIALAGR